MNRRESSRSSAPLAISGRCAKLIRVIESPRKLLLIARSVCPLTNCLRSRGERVASLI
jgi:hypothetical protein